VKGFRKREGWGSPPKYDFRRKREKSRVKSVKERAYSNREKGG